MADQQARYRDALVGWEKLQHESCFSYPDTYGKIAILCSQAVFDSRQAEVSEQTQEEFIEDERRLYVAEAHHHADMYRELDRIVEVAIAPTHEDVISIVRDPSVSSIVTIGCGSINHFILDIDEDGHHSTIEWEQMARAADHLKQGQFVQRHCGHYNEGMPLPLGALVMTRFSNVYLPLGKNFVPTELDDPNEADIIRFTRKRSLSYRELREVQKKHDPFPSRRQQGRSLANASQ